MVLARVRRFIGWQSQRRILAGAVFWAIMFAGVTAGVVVAATYE